MRAEVISIGTELLLGQITDTNATYIAQELSKIGLDLIFRTTVGDNQDRIATVIKTALTRVDIVITTGGLGPTVDDVTREGIAQATGKPLEFHQALQDQIAERFRRFGVTMTDNNLRQAFAPIGAQVIENIVGTAPIFFLKIERGTIMTLPGVPREMQYLMEHEVLPWLRAEMGSTSIIKSLTLRSAGMGESQIDAHIADLMTLINPTVGLAAHAGQTDIRVTSKAASVAEADDMIRHIEGEIRQRIGDWIYGTGEEALEDVVLSLLKQQGSSLAVTESGIQGRLHMRLTKSEVDAVSAIHYSEMFGANGGGSLKEVVEREASALQAAHNATYGLAAILVEDSDSNETEIAIAVANAKNTRSRVYTWQVNRPDAHIWVTTHSLAMLWRAMTEKQE